MNNRFIDLVEVSLRNNWHLNALTDFNGITLQYRDVARKIEKMHILFGEVGIKPGDRIALCGRNSAHWCVAFLATVTYGAVVVPILHEFKADNIHYIVNHSEARLLFVGDQVWENLNETNMSTLEGIVLLNDYSVVYSRNEKLTYAREHLNELFGHRFPQYFRAEHIRYECKQSLEDMAVINYTSGTTGFSKGVMLPYRSLLSNVQFCHDKIGIKPGDNIVSMLPLGHVFGLVYDFLYGVCSGAHIYFLTRMPSPKIIMTTVAEIHPRIISCVPLVVEKLFKQEVLPKLDNKLGKLLFRTPFINDKLKEYARAESMKLFGGNFLEIIIGGAPFNAEIEAFLRQIKFPYSIAYGLTECGPIICHSRWDDMRHTSCGRVADRMEVRIQSADPEHIAGELCCRGDNLMLGYYHNESATAEVIDKDGWLHTGDLAVMDADGYVYIKGRSKNMLLSTNGQNIYPEEIEAKLNNMPGINESLVVMAHGKLVALIYPEQPEDTALKSFDQATAESLLEQSRKQINMELPAYAQIAKCVCWPEEFEKTAKKSIKRYLYQNVMV